MKGIKMENNSSSKIYDLLESKNWENLTNSEKEILKTEGITQDSFNQLKITNNNLMLYKNYTEAPPKHIHTNLMNAAKLSVRNKSIFNRSYPLKYYLAASIILFVAAYFMVNRLNLQPKETITKIVTIDKIIFDTVYVAVNAIAANTSKSEKIQNLNKTNSHSDLADIKSSSNESDTSFLNISYNQFMGLKNLIFIPLNKNGVNFTYDTNIIDKLYVPETEYTFY